MPPKGRASVSSSSSGRRRSSATSDTPPKKGSAGSRRARSPVFWGCVSDTYFYAGPMGEPVGEVAAGAVVVESQRFQDNYNNWWVSTRSTEGSVMWFSVFDASRPLEELQSDKADAAAPAWKRVYDSRATQADNATVNRDKSNDITTVALQPSQCGSGIKLEEVLNSPVIPNIIELYDYYWTSLAPKKEPRDLLKTNWNLRYQCALDDYLFNKKVSNIIAKEKLDALVREFENKTLEVVQTITADMVKSLSDRKIRQHPSIPGYFYETNGILVQLCIDSGSGVFGGETRAEKVALNYFKSHQMFSVEGPKHLLYVPLMTQLRYNGYVFLATAIPPVSSPACVYAAPSAEKPIDVPDVVAHALTEMGNVFNLEEHVVEVNGERWKTKLPLDLRVYVGTDRRMYLVNTGRLLPPQLPLKAEPVKSRKNSSATTVTHSQFLTESLIHRVRPELLLGSKVSLNPDVAVDKCHSTEDVSHSLDIAEYVRGDGCTSIAGQVGLQFPVDAPLLPILNCLLCEKEMDNEFRFVCCQNPDGCCSICAECYTKRMYETLVQETNKKQESNKGKEDTGRSGEGEDTEGEGQTFISPDSSTPQADFSDVARCGNPKKSPTLFPSLSQIFHINGINLSNLPYVYYRLPPASKFAVRHFLEVEIIARASRQLLHSKLRGSTTPDQVASTIENFFVPLLQERTPNAFKFWSKELGPEITKMYPAIAEPFDTSAIPLDLLVNRVQEVTGVYLTKASIASFVEPLDKRFVQIERVVPRCKTVRFPVLEGSETESEKLEVGNTLEKMLLFWIGYAPEGSVEALQPFYLEDTVGVA